MPGYTSYRPLTTPDSSIISGIITLNILVILDNLREKDTLVWWHGSVKHFQIRNIQNYQPGDTLDLTTSKEIARLDNPRISPTQANRNLTKVSKSDISGVELVIFLD